jgi:hypothetical protein
MLIPAQPGLAVAAVTMISDQDIDDPELRATIAAAIESTPGHFGSFARPRGTQGTLRRSRSKMIAVALPASMAPTGQEAEQPVRQNHSELKGQMAHAAQAVNALSSKLFKNMRVKVRDNLINDWLQEKGLPRIPPRTMRSFFKKRPL